MSSPPASSLSSSSLSLPSQNERRNDSRVTAVTQTSRLLSTAHPTYVAGQGLSRFSSWWNDNNNNNYDLNHGNTSNSINAGNSNNTSTSSLTMNTARIMMHSMGVLGTDEILDASGTIRFRQSPTAVRTSNNNYNNYNYNNRQTEVSKGRHFQGQTQLNIPSDTLPEYGSLQSLFQQPLPKPLHIKSNKLITIGHDDDDKLSTCIQVDQRVEEGLGIVEDDEFLHGSAERNEMITTATSMSSLSSSSLISWPAIFGIVKGTVGPAILYLPHGFRLAGWKIAIVALCVATASYLYSSVRLLECWKVEKKIQQQQQLQQQQKMFMSMPVSDPMMQTQTLSAANNNNKNNIVVDDDDDDDDADTTNKCGQKSLMTSNSVILEDDENMETDEEDGQEEEEERIEKETDERTENKDSMMASTKIVVVSHGIQEQNNVDPDESIDDIEIVYSNQKEEEEEAEHDAEDDKRQTMDASFQNESELAPLLKHNMTKTDKTVDTDGVEDGTASNEGNDKDNNKSIDEALDMPHRLLTYPELAYRAFGPSAIFVRWGIAAMQLGVCLTYLIFVPQNLVVCWKSLHSSYDTNDVMVGSELDTDDDNDDGSSLVYALIVIFMVLIELPLVWIQDIRKLTMTNILATILIAFGLLACVWMSLGQLALEADESSYLAFNTQEELMDNAFFNETFPTDETENDDAMPSIFEVFWHRLQELPATQDTWLLFVGTSFFVFEGSITLLVPLQEAVAATSVIQSIAPSSSSSKQFLSPQALYFSRTNVYVTCAIVVMYIVFAMICWASLGDSVQTALTASLPPGIGATYVQGAYSLAVMWTFPLQAFPALQVICGNASPTITKVGDGTKYPGTNRRRIVASIVTITLGALAYVTRNALSNVVSLVGALVGIPIALIFPPLMHNRLVVQRIENERGMESTTFASNDNDWWTSPQIIRLMNYSIAALGVIAMVSASFTTLRSWDMGTDD